MSFWIDHKIFGDGHGLKSPYFDNRFYWLVDTSRYSRSARRGALYTFMYGFGAQLHSRQWLHPKPGERRTLIGREFVAFSSSRRWLRVEVAWAMTSMPRDIDGQHRAIRALAADLNSTLMEPSRRALQSGGHPTDA